MSERKGSARRKTKNQSGNNHHQCGNQGHYHCNSNFYINKLFPAPPVNNILPVGSKTKFICNQHNQQKPRKQ